MRNFTYFMSAFLISAFLFFMLGMVTGCTMPPRKPEPYEQRSSPKPQRELTRMEKLEQYADQRKREYSTWWNCTRYKSSLDCK